MNRRSLLKALAAVPFLGFLAPKLNGQLPKANSLPTWRIYTGPAAVYFNGEKLDVDGMGMVTKLYGDQSTVITISIKADPATASE